MFSLQSLSFFLSKSMRKFTIFIQTTMLLEYIQNFAYPLSSISLGMTVVPWRNWKQWSSNIFFLGGGGEGNNLHHGPCENGEWLNTAGYLTQYFVFASLTAFLNKYLIRSIFSSSGPDHRIHLHYSGRDKTKHKIVKQVLHKRLSIQFNLINYVSQSQQTKTIR